jgi:TRAP-type mannitol/chloroaromatic compound transport system substrate-binding protein
MKQRWFLAGAALAAALALAAAGGGESTEATPDGPAGTERFAWKMVTTGPPGFPILQDGAQRLAERVGTMSGGRLSIKVYAGGELIPPLQTFDAVSEGTVEMGHGAAYYWAGKVPAAQFFTAVPFGMNAQGMNAWLYAGGGLELWRELYRPFDLVPFPAGNTAVQMGGWFNKRIDSVSDLEGLKMRIPGFGGKVFARAGGVPVLLPGSEVFTALDRGTLDAAEWVGPAHDLRLGLHHAARYYYYPGWQEPSATLELIVNLRAWESLPPDLQAIVSEAAAAMNEWTLAEFETRNAEALVTLAQKTKVELLEFPPEVLRELHRHTREALAELAAADEGFRRIHDAYESFRARNDAWNAISEAAMGRARAKQAGQ